MTRKDYIKLAAAFAVVEAMNEDISDEAGIGASTLRLTVAVVSDALRDDNPRFDGERFAAAALPIGTARREAMIQDVLDR